MTRNRQYILDTNALIEFALGNPAVIAKALETGLHSCCMSVISLHELYYGALLARQKSEKYYVQELTRIRKLLDCFDVMPLPVKADGYAYIKMALRKKGKPVDEFDMIIGGQAIDEGLIVVTDNIRHFENMPSVRVVNWNDR